jgi:hypothetical protein
MQPKNVAAAVVGVATFSVLHFSTQATHNKGSNAAVPIICRHQTVTKV